METVIITTLVSTAAAGVSALLSWFLSKKKYYSEVDSSNIKNMQDSLQFYITLSDDYKRRLDEEIQSHKKEVAELKNENKQVLKELRDQEIKFNEQLRAQQQEINMMKNQMIAVYSQVCLNFKCLDRIGSNEIKENSSEK
mgnify:CR=1 FL=1